MIKSTYARILGGSFQTRAQALPTCFGAIVLSLALFCGTLSVPATARRTAAHGKSVKGSSAVVIPRRVLALYYPWYGTPAFGGKWIHQAGVNVTAKSIASHTHYPLSGPYDSIDPAVIDRHLRQARAAGIDTLVCSWWGQNDRTDLGILRLLKLAPKYSMTVCVFWEPSQSALTPQNARADLKYILQAFTKQPAYLRHSGKPVVFLYSQTSQSLMPNQWAGLLKEASGGNPPGILAITDNENPAVWDGSYSLWPITQMGGLSPAQSAQTLHRSFQAQIPGKKAFNHLTVETVTPGYDDRKYNAHTENGPGTLVDRLNGQRYRSLWEQALKDAPDWILINSFNQWHNGTEIEPSKEMGDRYLQLTGVYTRRFKAADAVPIIHPLRP